MNSPNYYTNRDCDINATRKILNESLNILDKKGMEQTKLKPAKI